MGRVLIEASLSYRFPLTDTARSNLQNDALPYKIFDFGESLLRIVDHGHGFFVTMRTIFAVALALLVGLFAPSSAMAGDVAHGEQVFSSNCAACHIGGGNVVNGQRTLQQDDLKAYLANYNDGHEAAIIYQVTNGKNGMPAFGGNLSDDEIADVAAFVESKSSNGWA